MKKLKSHWKIVSLMTRKFLNDWNLYAYVDLIKDFELRNARNWSKYRLLEGQTNYWDKKD